MGKIYDISMKITNELPKLQITDDILVTINNRKSTILNIQAMALENDRIAKESPDEASSDFEQMTKALKLLVGEDNAAKIDALDLPIDEYKNMYESIMKIAQGLDPAAPLE